MGEKHGQKKADVSVVRAGKIFLVVVVVEAILLVVLQILNIVLNSDEAEAIDSLYAVLIIFSLVFFVYFAIDGIWFENFIQICAFLGYSVLFAAYIVYQFTFDTKNPILLVQFIAVIVGEIALFSLSYKLYLEFGWRIYKKIGADPHMCSMYRTYQIFLTLLKLDFQFQFVLLAINLVVILDVNDYEWAINIGGVPLLIIAVALSIYGIRHENKNAVIVFLVMAILEPAYIIFRTVRLLGNNDPLIVDLMPQFVACAVFSLCMRVAVVTTTVMCLRNFGNHLPERIGQISKDSVANNEASGFSSFNNRRMTVV